MLEIENIEKDGNLDKQYLILYKTNFKNKNTNTRY